MPYLSYRIFTQVQVKFRVKHVKPGIHLYQPGHILTFDPLLALKKAHCPVLGVFGELDPLTPAQRTTENMRKTLTEAGHKDFMLKIFPQVGHSLSELLEKNRMAPGVFETLRTWLLERM